MNKYSRKNRQNYASSQPCAAPSQSQRFARDKRLEPARANPTLFDCTLIIARNSNDLLTCVRSGIRPCCNKEAVLAKRSNEIFWNLIEQAMHDYPVEGAEFWQYRKSVAKDDCCVGDRKLRKPGLCLDRKTLEALDRKHFARKPCEERRRIA